MTTIAVTGPLDTEHLQTEGPDAGKPWPFLLVRDDVMHFSDSRTDLVGLLIPGYADLPDGVEGDDQALIMRWQTAVLTASDVQALICADRVHEGLFDPAKESNESLTVLFSDKTVAVNGIESWDHPDVPLVLVSTDYDPYTERPPVMGNVLWLDPSDETAFLNSLKDLGVIEFYAHAGETDE